MNSRLDTIQAAILQVKLKAFREYELEAVNRVAFRYTDLLKEVPHLKTPVIPEGFSSSWAQYTIRLETQEQRDNLQAALKAEGIPSMVYYPKPMHAQAAFANSKSVVNHSSLFTNHASHLSKTVLSLPMHPYMTDEDIQSLVICL